MVRTVVGTLLVQLFLLILAAGGYTVNATASDFGHAHRAYRRECKVESEIVALKWEPEIGKYQKQIWNGSDDRDGDGHRKLQKKDQVKGIRGVQVTNQFFNVFSGVDSSIKRGLAVSDVVDNNDELLPVDNPEFDDAVLVRSCFCRNLSPVYCPLEVDHCAVIRSYNETIHGPSPLVCLDTKDAMQEFTETTFLIVFLWMSILFSFVVVTRWGRNCVHYLLAKCIPGYNKLLAWFLLRTNRDLAREMLHQQVHSRRSRTMERIQRISPGSMPETLHGQDNGLNQTMHPIMTNHQDTKPTGLALKTRTFTSSTCLNDEDSLDLRDGSQEEEFDHDCAICFQSVGDGDLVGDLPCRHLFHVSCLKTWLQRRNNCPLCNAEEIAAPRNIVIKKNQSCAETDSTTNTNANPRVSSERNTDHPRRIEDATSHDNENVSQVE